jgi:hypothetical protein
MAFITGRYSKSNPYFSSLSSITGGLCPISQIEGGSVQSRAYQEARSAACELEA